MFTPNTQIPTSVRAQIRSMVKAHGAWKAWYTARGIVSATAKNSEILEFALLHPALASAVDAILAANPITPGNPASSGTVDPNDFNDAEDHAEGVLVPVDNAEEDARMNEMLDDTANGKSETYDVDAVLAGVRQFLGSAVLDTLRADLLPVITAANKPAVERVVEIERVVEVEAGQATPRATKPKARRDRKVTFRQLFPSRAKDIWRDAQLTLWNAPSGASPAVDAMYVVNHYQMAVVMTAIERGQNTWVWGPSSSGKGSIAMQAAANLGRPFVKIEMRKSMDVEALIGGDQFRNGQTVWVDGALTAAMRQPGTVILFDELTLAPPAVQAIAHHVSDDHRSLTLPTGEVVKAADGVCFMVADNTNGSGDEGGLYAGTSVSNVATVTRFKRMLLVDYLTPQQEAEALANHTGCPLAAARHLADFAERTRRLPQLAGVVISLRKMVGFVNMVQDGFKVADAFKTCMSSHMPSTERAAMEASADLAFQDTFESLLHGKVPTAAPLKPSNSAASQAFAQTETY